MKEFTVSVAFCATPSTSSLTSSTTDFAVLETVATVSSTISVNCFKSPFIMFSKEKFSSPKSFLKRISPCLTCPTNASIVSRAIVCCSPKRSVPFFIPFAKSPCHFLLALIESFKASSDATNTSLLIS